MLIQGLRQQWASYALAFSQFEFYNSAGQSEVMPAPMPPIYHIKFGFTYWSKIFFEHLEPTGPSLGTTAAQVSEGNSRLPEGQPEDKVSTVRQLRFPTAEAAPNGRPKGSMDELERIKQDLGSERKAP